MAPLPRTKVKDHDSRLLKIGVVVVDNDEIIIGLLTNVLKKLGFKKIYQARDGFQAVEILNSQTIDLVITDWELAPLPDSIASNSISPSDKWGANPPENGARFVQYVRGSENSQNPYLPIIMLTGNALRHNVEYARDSGVDDILVKPVSAGDLCSRLIKIVNATRFFINASTYKGPCRRRKASSVPPEEERRKTIPQVIPQRLT